MGNQAQAWPRIVNNDFLWANCERLEKVLSSFGLTLTNEWRACFHLQAPAGSRKFPVSLSHLVIMTLLGHCIVGCRTHAVGFVGLQTIFFFFSLLGLFLLSAFNANQSIKILYYYYFFKKINTTLIIVTIWFLLILCKNKLKDSCDTSTK